MNRSRDRIFVDVHGAARMVGLTPYHFRERFAEPNNVRVITFEGRSKAKQFFLVREIQAAARKLRHA